MLGAVDIGGTKIAVAMVDDNGCVAEKREFPTDVALGFDHAMRRVAAALAECGTRAQAKVDGIGIGCTGQVDAMTGNLGNVHNLPGWEGRNPVEVLGREFGVPTAMENDADAAALGEVHCGAAKGKASLVYVTVGTGIGVSVILNNKIYRGVDNCHPEIGHHILEPAGPVCSCGARGCWESLASGPSMSEWIRVNAPASYATQAVSAQAICSRAQSGDEWALRAVENQAYYLGLGLANLVVLFAPEAIVMGGSVMKSAHLFWDRIHEIIRQHCRLVPFEQVDISLASLGDDVALIGAAQVWRHRFQHCKETVDQ